MAHALFCVDQLPGKVESAENCWESGNSSFAGTSMWIAADHSFVDGLDHILLLTINQIVTNSISIRGLELFHITQPKVHHSNPNIPSIWVRLNHDASEVDNASVFWDCIFHSNRSGIPVSTDSCGSLSLRPESATRPVSSLNQTNDFLC
jgi:hypothetical protein